MQTCMLITLSAQHMREEIERKAYAYGVSPVVAFLLGEHAVSVLREARHEQENAVMAAATA